jgi:DNA polymerase-3 subunit beta
MIAVNVDVLSRKLQPLFKVASYNKVIPILDHILFEVIENGLYATASNMETQIKVKIDDIAPTKSIAFCIEAKALGQLIKTLKESVISFKYDASKEKVVIRTDYGSYSLPTLNFEEFPIIELIGKRKEELLPIEILGAISNALPFIAKDEMRPSVSQLLLQVDGTKINVVATDAHTLYLETLSLINSVNKEKYQINVNPKAAQVMAFVSCSAHIPVIHTTNSTAFLLGDYDLTAINVQEKFPAYESVMPKDLPVVYSFRKDLFENAVKRATIFDFSFKLSLNEGNKIQIVSYNMDTQKEMKEDLSGSCSGVLDIGFATETTLRALAALSGSEAVMTLATNNKPAVFIEGAKKVLIMPVMVK